MPFFILFFLVGLSGAFGACGLSQDSKGVYLVGNYAQLKMVGIGDCPVDTSSAYRLTADIDASASMAENPVKDSAGNTVYQGFVPIGTDSIPFQGHFYGDGHLIRNLTIYRPDSSYVGLLGCTGNSAIVTEIGLIGGSITGNSYVGALIGEAKDGFVRFCFSAVSVKGRRSIGGLVGYNRGLIDDSYTTGIVSGGNRVGGLTGATASSSMNDYASGPVIAVMSSDGISAGPLSGTLDRVLSDDSYWNTETSGQIFSTNGTGLTSSQMMDSSSYSIFWKSSKWIFLQGKAFPFLKGFSDCSMAYKTRLASFPKNSVFSTTAGYTLKGGTSLVGRIQSVLGLNATRDSLYYVYRLGAISNGDTLWGAGALVAIPDNLAEVEIFDYEGLKAISKNDPELTRSYRLSADIDASASAGENCNAEGNSCKGFTPIGTPENPFKGDFHGGGHAIQNLTVHYPDENAGDEAENIGLFGSMSGARVDSLALDSADFVGCSSTGVLAGYSNGSEIREVHVQGKLITDGYGDYAGGLIGFSLLTSVENSSADVSVDANGSDVGGLIGYLIYGIVSKSFARGSVSGRDDQGGLVGLSDSSSITECYATGSVNAFTSYAGGLVGVSSHGTTVFQSFATGEVYGWNNAGGLIGAQYSGSITQCYATGKVRGYKGGNWRYPRIGGLVGYQTKGSIYESYSTSSVSGDEMVGGLIGSGDNVTEAYFAGSVKGKDSIGAILGEDTYHPQISPYCYWNNELSGGSLAASADEGPVGYNTIQMKRQAFFSGFDFINTWTIREDRTYPGLRGVDNAPFAIPETWEVAGSFDLHRLLENDYDIETLQKNLVMTVVSINGDSSSVTTCTPFLGQKITVVYRVGEVREAKKDTLWGNEVSSNLIGATQTRQGILPEVLVNNFVRLRLADGVLDVRGVRGKLQVYSLRGTRVADLSVSRDGVYPLSLSAGVYLIRADSGRTWNVNVK